MTKNLAVGTLGSSTTEYLLRDVVSIIVTDRDDQEHVQINPLVWKGICNPMQALALDIAESTNI